MKILLVLEHFWPAIGGVERLFESLTERFAQQGMQVDVVTLQLPNTEELELHKGVRIHRVKARNRYWFTLLGFFRAFELAAEVDMIQTSTYTAAFPAWLAARLRGKKIALTVHEVLGRRWFDLPELAKWKACLFWLYERMLLWLPFDRYICVSEATKADLLETGVSAGKVEVIYNGINYDYWQRQQRSLFPKRKPVTFLYYGRAGYTKGVMTLMQAWTSIVHRIPHLKLNLLLSNDGSGVYEKVQEWVYSKGLGESVKILKPVADEQLLNFLVVTDCVIVPSLTEGFGFTVAETAALGQRLIVSDAGSIPEVVSGEYISFESGDVDSLERAILKAHWGEFETKPLKKFELEQTMKAYTNLYEDLLTG